RVRIDATSRFKQAWLDHMCRLGKNRGFLAEAPRAFPRGPRLQCFTGIDLGIGKSDMNAKSSIFTIARTREGRRLIVDIQSGGWPAPELLDRVESIYRRFDSTILVEDNGTQMFIVQMLQGRVPVMSQTTTAHNKFHEEFGVESLAVEMRNGL